MHRLRYNQIARTNLAEIAEFIAEDSKVQAGRVISGIRKTCHTIARTPGIGRFRPDLTEGIRSFPVGSYVIFYHVASDVVEIIAVIHGARDVTRIMGTS